MNKTLNSPNIRLQWIGDPVLEFGNGNYHSNPKIGIPLYGPRSLHTTRHKDHIHIAYIGDMQALEKVRSFLNLIKNGVTPENIESNSITFPGLNSEVGYRIDLIESDDLIGLITTHEKDNILSINNKRERFHTALDLYESKVKFLVEKDHPLDYIFVVLSEEIYKSISSLKNYNKTQGNSVSNFRRSLKARLMKYGKPTQIFRESTTGLTDEKRELEDISNRAWNLSTAMYYKIGGLPWAPVNLGDSTCYVGISFYHPINEPNNIRSSIAQAFDQNGEGLVLRGQQFRLNDKIDKSPHLPYEQAKELIDQVLIQYQNYTKQFPKKVVIHKSSRFDIQELQGFKDALKIVSEFDLVTVGESSNFRVLRAGQYPPLRGTVASIGDNHLLYSIGYIPNLGKYPHGHVPRPLRILDHHGDTSEIDLLKEILILSKMNWNSANIDGFYPITLQFSRLVGEILKEIPEDIIPNPRYIYYM